MRLVCSQLRSCLDLLLLKRASLHVIKKVSMLSASSLSTNLAYTLPADTLSSHAQVLDEVSMPSAISISPNPANTPSPHTPHTQVFDAMSMPTALFSHLMLLTLLPHTPLAHTGA